MSRFHSVLPAAPLRDAGLVEFAADNAIALKTIQEAIADANPNTIPFRTSSPQLTLPYDNQQPLLKLMSRLQRQLKPQSAQGVQCRITYDSDKSELRDEDNGSDQGWIPLAELFGEVGGRSLYDYILYRLYTTYLQPVVDRSGDVIGYEFLMRPFPEQMPFRPAELFEASRRIGLHSFLDRAARYSAIQLGASHLQEGMKRFINFLPSSLHCPDACLRGTFEMIEESGTVPGDYIFEVMETEPLDDPKLVKIFDNYRSRGVKLALDDVGKGYASLDIVDRLKPDYVKMDRKWVSHCERDSDKQRYIQDLLERVSRFQGVVLAEGVERAEEWEYLKQAGVPLYQGYLFGRAAPIPLAHVRIGVV